MYTDLMPYKKILLLFVIITTVILAFYLTQKKFVPGSIYLTGEGAKPPLTTNFMGTTKVKYQVDTTIVLIGDSMTERLGNSDEIRFYLKEYYPGRSFEVLNYGFGSTNILSVYDRLTKTIFHTRDFRPISEIYADLILIESFGNNPLSEYPLEDGLKRQIDELDKIISTIKKYNPEARIIFVATIAPNSKQYGNGIIDLDSEQKQKWVEERVSYIRNHIKYASEHNFPVINIFESSLNQDGDGNLEYLDKTDYIHPSPNGILFISREIADFLHKNNLVN